MRSDLRLLWTANGGGFYTNVSPHDRLRAASCLNAKSVCAQTPCEVRKEWSVLVDGQPAVVPGLAGASGRVPLSLFWGMRWQKHSGDQTQTLPALVDGVRMFNPLKQARDARRDDFAVGCADPA